MSIYHLRPRTAFPLLARVLLLTGLTLISTLSAAQATPPVPTQPKNPPVAEVDHNRRLERRFLINLGKDQASIWTSPFRMKLRDGLWLVPAAALTGEIVHRDAYLYSQLRFQGNGVTSARFSDAGMLAMGGLIGASYLAGHIRSAPQARETGILGTQAALNSLAVAYALKYSLRRQRPFAGDQRGSFFNSGSDAESFPSTHAMVTWSMASVFAHEYPGVLTKIGAYGLASAVSIARVTGRKHFPSDVLVGSAIGWAIGRHVYRTHHDEGLGGASIGTIIKDEEPNTSGSPYVPLDHWAYAAFDRLAAMNLLHSDFAGLRPWTRRECARLVEEAELEWDLAAEAGHPGAPSILRALRKEFGGEAPGDERRSDARIESVYARATNISGEPLVDGYHFGQTLINDYGRPVQAGVNTVAGASAWGKHGRWSVYVRGEFQHAPEADALSLATRTHISQVDFIPLQPGLPFRQVDRMRFLDAYVAVNVSDWQISAGKQSLWWGPGKSGSFMFSNNVDPLLMFRVNRVTPLMLPWVLRFLGPVRGEVFFGQLSGHRFVRLATGDLGPGLSRQPLIHGAKLNLKPTRNFEFGVSVTTIWAGPGEPLTFRTFWRSVGSSNTVPGQPNDPGDRRAGFDFRYRVPGLRNWLTFYNESFAEDEISPLAFPRRSAMHPGLFLSHVPGVPNLDLRAEGFYTDLPGLRPFGFLYFNNKYLDGYTNAGQLIGHWIGRQGSGFFLQGRYWLAPRNVLTVEHRDARVSDQFVPGGGSSRTTALSGVFLARNELEFSGRVQHERWRFAPLQATPQTNVTVQLQVTFWPSRWRTSASRTDRASVPPRKP